jgi:hypothetical protein
VAFIPRHVAQRIRLSRGQRARDLFADRGYDHGKYRRLPRARGITPRTPAAASFTAPASADTAG